MGPNTVAGVQDSGYLVSLGDHCMINV